MDDLKIRSAGQLKGAINTLFNNYNANFHLYCLEELSGYSLTEQQFALLIGRCRMYQHLPRAMQNEIRPLQLGDNQIGCVVKDYYKDDSFCNTDGNINLWKLYNLFTGACKSTYIDNFLDRSVNAFQFADKLRIALKDNTPNWFLH